MKTHLPCPDCESSDALTDYGDHTFCFSCETYKTNKDVVMPTDLIKGGEFHALTERKISETTCKKFGYKVSKVKGKACHIAPYYKDGKVVGQKLRFPNKQFETRGDFKDISLFGQQLWKEGGKRVVVCEGEIDALSYNEVNPTWPVVSIPNGAPSAKTAIARNIDFLESFEEVTFIFDNDPQGQKAAKDCCEILSPGKASNVALPLKDINEMVKQNRVKELVNSVYNAKPLRPDGIINGKEIWEDVRKPMEKGIEYPFQDFNRILYGIRAREICTITAGSGVGKSTLVAQIAYDCAIRHNRKVGYVALEESLGRTGLRFMSMAIKKPLHLSEEVSEAQKRLAFDKTLGTENFYLYDHFGSLDSDNLLNKLKYMVIGCGVQYLFLDHLSILLSGAEFMVVGGDERKQIDYVMTKLRSFTEQTNVSLFLVCHLRRPTTSDKGFEDGLEPSLSSLRGSQSISQLSDSVLSVSRNASEGENKIKVRCLKNRHAGITGDVCSLNYNSATGLLEAETEFDDAELPL